MPLISPSNALAAAVAPIASLKAAAERSAVSVTKEVQEEDYNLDPKDSEELLLLLTEARKNKVLSAKQPHRSVRREKRSAAPVAEESPSIEVKVRVQLGSRLQNTAHQAVLLASERSAAPIAEEPPYTASNSKELLQRADAP